MAKPKEIRTLVVARPWNAPPVNEVGTIKINLEGRLVDAEVLGIEVEQDYMHHPYGSPNLQKYSTVNLIVRGQTTAIGCEPVRGVIPYLYLYVPELDKSL